MAISNGRLETDIVAYFVSKLPEGHALCQLQNGLPALSSAEYHQVNEDLAIYSLNRSEAFLPFDVLTELARSYSATAVKLYAELSDRVREAIALFAKQQNVPVPVIDGASEGTGQSSTPVDATGDSRAEISARMNSTKVLQRQIDNIWVELADKTEEEKLFALKYWDQYARQLAPCLKKELQKPSGVSLLSRSEHVAEKAITKTEDKVERPRNLSHKFWNAIQNIANLMGIAAASYTLTADPAGGDFNPTIVVIVQQEQHAHTPNFYEAVVTAQSGLLVRSSENNGVVVGGIPYGSVVTVEQEYESMSLIRYDNDDGHGERSGFVSNNWIKRKDEK